MNNSFLRLLLFAFIAATASGITITDTNDYGATTNGLRLNGSGASISDVFNITAGFNPSTQQITSATADFYLWDLTGSNPEVATITLGGSFFGSATNFAGVVQIDGNIVGSVLLDLQADGILGYTVQNTTAPGGGTRDFYLSKAVLSAEVVDRPRVPEDGLAFVLLGSCLAGLAMFRRRVRA